MALGYSVGSMLGLGVVGVPVYMVMMRMSAGLAAKVANSRKDNGSGINRNNNPEGSWDMQEQPGLKAARIFLRCNNNDLHLGSDTCIIVRQVIIFRSDLQYHNNDLQCSNSEVQ